MYERLGPESADLGTANPPYNVQLPLTMAAGALAETHANRRTDYAMVSDLEADLAARADRVGFIPKGDLIWYQAGTRLRPYGYPRVFVPNIVHQHILVFRKETARAQSSRLREAR